LFDFLLANKKEYSPFPHPKSRILPFSFNASFFRNLRLIICDVVKSFFQ